MVFSWQVYCDVCGTLNTTGDLSSSQEGWTKDQILANAIHNPGCRIIKFHLTEDQIATTEDDTDPQNTVYHVMLAS